MQLDKQQRDDFFTRGFTRLPSAFSRDAASAMEAHFWSLMERRDGARRDDPSTWPNGLVTGLGELKHEPEFQQIGSPVVLSAIDDLLGQGAWPRPANWGQILATFPSADRKWSWDSIWHTDYPYDTPPDEIAGLQVFALLADLAPGGGATLVIEGSPLLIQGFVRKQPARTLEKMKRAREALMVSDAWLSAISQPVTLDRPEGWLAEQRSIVDGVEIGVVELAGEAGDVFLCHPWLLHSLSPNVNDAPRLMCTQRLRKHR